MIKATVTSPRIRFIDLAGKAKKLTTLSEKLDADLKAIRETKLQLEARMASTKSGFNFKLVLRVKASIIK
jgi:hypothetical protein